MKVTMSLKDVDLNYILTNFTCLTKKPEYSDLPNNNIVPNKSIGRSFDQKVIKI